MTERGGARPPLSGDPAAMDPAQTLRQASYLHGQGRLIEAEARYRDVVAAMPDNADAWHFLGVLEGQSGRLENALEHIGRAVALAPGNAVAHYNLGNSLKDLRRSEESLLSFDRALAIDP